MPGEDRNDESQPNHQEFNPCHHTWDDIDGYSWQDILSLSSSSDEHIQLGQQLIITEAPKMSKLNNGATDSGTSNEAKQVPNEFPKEKGKEKILSPKKRSRSFNDRESSEAALKGEGKEERVVELMKTRTPINVRRILAHRIDRRLKNVQSSETGSFACFFTLAMEKKLPDDQRESTLNALKKITENWPARFRLLDIKTRIRNVNCKKLGDEESWQTLINLDMEIVKSDEDSQKLLKSANKLQNSIIKGEKLDKETAKDMFSEIFPCLSMEAFASGGPTADDTEGGLQVTFGTNDMEDFGKKAFADNKRKVKVSDFPGLEDAMSSNKWNIPNDLKCYAAKMGEDPDDQSTDIEYKIGLAKVCATMKEMEEMPVEELNRDSLLKWGATLNRAKKLDFRVEFAEKLYKKIFYAYFGFQHSKTDEDTGNKRKKLKGVEIRGLALSR